MYFLSARAVILLVGGKVERPGLHGSETIGVVESFDPLTNQRQIVAPLPEPLSSQMMAVLGKEYYHSLAPSVQLAASPLYSLPLTCDVVSDLLISGFSSVIILYIIIRGQACKGLKPFRIGIIPFSSASFSE